MNRARPRSRRGGRARTSVHHLRPRAQCRRARSHAGAAASAPPGELEPGCPEQQGVQARWSASSSTAPPARRQRNHSRESGSSNESGRPRLDGGPPLECRHPWQAASCRLVSLREYGCQLAHASTIPPSIGARMRTARSGGQPRSTSSMRAWRSELVVPGDRSRPCHPGSRCGLADRAANSRAGHPPGSVVVRWSYHLCVINSAVLT